MILEMASSPIKVYPIYANALSIILTHEESYGWFLNNFIQIINNDRNLTFYDFNYKSCPFLNVQKIKKTLCQKYFGGIINFIIESIKNNNYVYLIVKTKYISAYKEDFNRHDMLIYGFDLDKKIFYIADCFKNRKYSFSTCTMNELNNAVKNLTVSDDNYLGFNGSIELLSYRNDAQRPFSRKRVIHSLTNYINCTGVSVWNTMDIRWAYDETDWGFGMHCYDFIIDKLYQGINQEIGQIPTQPIHLFYEHKEQLTRIVEYMNNVEGMRYNEELVALKELETKAKTARNLSLKYNLFKDKKSLLRAIDIYKEMYILEKRILPQLIKNMCE